LVDKKKNLFLLRSAAELVHFAVQLALHRMSDWQKQVVCRYFVLGSCTKGDACAYSHDPNLIPQSTGFEQVPGYEDAYYQDYVGDEVVDFGEGFSQAASDFGADTPLDSGEGFVSEVYPVEYGCVGEGMGGGEDEEARNPEDPGGGVNDETFYDNSSCQIHGLSVGVNAMSLDPCSDPNCLDNPQSLIEAQEYNPNSVYPTSPTYIVYTPVYQSPALSPAAGPLPLMSPPPPSGLGGPLPLLSPPPAVIPQPISIVTTPGGLSNHGSATLSPSSGVISPSGVLRAAVLSPTGLGPSLMQVHQHHHPLHHQYHPHPHQLPLEVHHHPQEVQHHYPATSRPNSATVSAHEQVGPGGAYSPPAPSADDAETATQHKSCLMPPNTNISPTLTSHQPSVITKGSPAIQSNLNPETAEFSPSKQEILHQSSPSAFTRQEKFSPKSSCGSELGRHAEENMFANVSQSSTGSTDSTSSISWRVPTNWAEAPEFVPPGSFSKPQPSTTSGGSLGQRSSRQRQLEDSSQDQQQQKPQEEQQPKQRSWAQVVNSNIVVKQLQPGNLTVSEAESQLCPFYRVGECRYGDICMYIHGCICDYCGQNILHPQHDSQRKAHLAECLREHERDMELSFAVARSKEKTCGVCMEIVLDKPKGDASFGILTS
jgi:hypothetical protein